jgi:hypothetical protein
MLTAAAAAAIVLGLAISSAPAWAAGNDPVLAEIGNQKITQQDVDARVSF